jgi:peptide/nickel transport system ATP-binding protein
MLIEFAHRIGVMYAGELVEMAKSETLFHRPQHPYTVGLMNSFPPLTGPKVIKAGIPGAPPNLTNPPPGCRFYPRCRYHDPTKRRLYDRQMTVKPELRETEPGHFVACHLYDADLADEGVHGLSTELGARNPELPVLMEESVTYAG